MAAAGGRSHVDRDALPEMGQTAILQVHTDH